MNFLQPPYQFMEFRAKRGSDAQERQRRSQPFLRRLDLLNQQDLAIPVLAPDLVPGSLTLRKLLAVD